MVAAGVLAKNAVAKGLTTKPWVKTSLAPGSKVVTDYLTDAGLIEDLDKLRFNLVGYGCTTCIGNSGPLPDAISKEIGEAKKAKDEARAQKLMADIAAIKESVPDREPQERKQ